MILTLRHESIGPPGGADRLRIAHLSDLHLWCSDRLLRALEPLLERAQPDVVALTGDYADTPLGQRLAVAWIRRLATHYPLCWIAGNHDHWWGAAFLRDLENIPRAHAIDRHDAWIVNRRGRRYRFTTCDRLAQGGRDPSEPAVILLHDPAEARACRFPHGAHQLLLAGHLHGGQIDLWRDRRGASYPTALLYHWVAERDTVDGAPIVVSRGLGDTLPLRLGVPREMVLVDFFAAETPARK